MLTAGWENHDLTIVEVHQKDGLCRRRTIFSSFTIPRFFLGKQILWYNKSQTHFLPQKKWRKMLVLICDALKLHTTKLNLMQPLTIRPIPTLSHFSRRSQLSCHYRYHCMTLSDTPAPLKVSQCWFIHFYLILNRSRLVAEDIETVWR